MLARACGFESRSGHGLHLGLIHVLSVPNLLTLSRHTNFGAPVVNTDGRFHFPSATSSTLAVAQSAVICPHGGIRGPQILSVSPDSRSFLFRSSREISTPSVE